MNRTLLLILCDFLLLNLLALTRWENAEPVRPAQPPVPEMGANAQTANQDLLAAMKQSLADERGHGDQIPAGARPKKLGPLRRFLRNLGRTRAPF